MRRNLMTLICLLLTVPVLLFGVASPGVAANDGYKRSVEKYRVPDVVLTNQLGKKVRLKPLLESGKPVVFDFFYATCTTICPVLSAGYANLQRQLGAESAKIQLVSVSIDPENDTPKVLKEHLQRYQGKPGWELLTGSRKDVDRVMRAFDAYVRDKMEHKPLTFIRTADGSWIRLDGLISSSEFMAELKKARLL